MKKPARTWKHKAGEMQEPFHYTGCGLDDIWLVGGYEILEIDGEQGVSIKDLDGLHQAIGRYLLNHKKLLNGPEIRFLRLQMDLTQSELAQLVGCDAQQIARYEKGENKIPGPADRLLRMIFQDHLHENVDVRALLHALDRLDARTNDRQSFRMTAKGWAAAA